MTYTVPPKPTPPKQHFVRVTDLVEIEAMQRSALRDPIGMLVQFNADEPEWWAEAHSLAQYRKRAVQFDV